MQKLKPIRDEKGIAVDFEIEGDFPKYGNNDDRVDEIAVDLVETFMNKITQTQNIPRFCSYTYQS